MNKLFYLYIIAIILTWTLFVAEKLTGYKWLYFGSLFAAYVSIISALYIALKKYI